MVVATIKNRKHVPDRNRRDCGYPPKDILRRATYARGTTRCTETDIAAHVILPDLIITDVARGAAETVCIQGMGNVPLVPHAHLNR